MKIWEIEAMSLRLMFADTDIQFSLEEFTAGTIYENSNTRDKLVRMPDSISRGIEQYYNYVGVLSRQANFSLVVTDGVTENKIDTSTTADFGYPTRVDAYLYQTVDGVDQLLRIKDQINFTYDAITQEILFLEGDDLASYYVDYDDYVVSLKVWYKTARLNIPAGSSELTYDLDTIFIPNGVQQMLPYFVKAELFEEDEPSIAQNARNQFFQYLIALPKPFSRSQTHVKRAKIFDK